MSHTHSHAHGHLFHNHHAAPVANKTSRALTISIFLNAAYVIVELIAGLSTHSVALLADAGHNLSDVLSLAISLLAFRLSRLKPTLVFTYGYKKTTILAALVNASVLMVAIGILGYHAVERLAHPVPVSGNWIALVAALGIVINAGSAYLFFHNRNELNARAAYLHLLTDALVAFSVVVSGLIIFYTQWYWLDAAISLVVLFVVLAGSWSLLSDSVRLSLDAVPSNINLNSLIDKMKAIDGVAGIHHVHVWAMSTTENALTAHVVLREELTAEEKQAAIQNLKQQLLRQNIKHSTLEVEMDNSCQEIFCSTENISG